MRKAQTGFSRMFIHMQIRGSIWVHITLEKRNIIMLCRWTLTAFHAMTHISEFCWIITQPDVMSISFAGHCIDQFSCPSFGRFSCFNHMLELTGICVLVLREVLMVWMVSAVRFGIRSHVNWKRSKSHLCISACFCLSLLLIRGNLLISLVVSVKLNYHFF